MLCSFNNLDIDSDFGKGITTEQLLAVLQQIPEDKIESCRKNIVDAIVYTAGLSLTRQSFDLMKRHNMIGDWIRMLYETESEDDVDRFLSGQTLQARWMESITPELGRYNQQRQKRQRVIAMRQAQIAQRRLAAATAAGGRSKVCALFLDNEPYNFIGCNQVADLECLLIPDQLKQKQDLYDSLVQKDEFLGEQTHRESLHEKTYFNFEISEIGPGIEQEHLDKIRQWTTDHSCSKMLFFFDWDRTLSVCEGCDMFPFTTAHYAEVYMSFLMGGKTRWAMLKKFFNDLRRIYSKRVEYYVITNNGFCTDKHDTNKVQAAYFDKFLKMVCMLFGDDFPEDHLICMHVKRKQIDHSSGIAAKVQVIQKIMSTYEN